MPITQKVVVDMIMLCPKCGSEQMYVHEPLTSKMFPQHCCYICADCGYKGFRLARGNKRERSS